MPQGHGDEARRFIEFKEGSLQGNLKQTRLFCAAVIETPKPTNQ